MRMHVTDSSAMGLQMELSTGVQQSLKPIVIEKKNIRRQHMKYDIFVQKPNQFETSCTSFP